MSRGRGRLWGLALISLALLLSFISYIYVPYDPNRTEIALRLQAPSRQRLLGTDHFGRDVFSRILAGGRVSLLISFGAVLIGAALGISLGLISGYWGKLGDEFLLRLSTALQALPPLLLALLLATILKPGRGVVLWSIAVGNIPIFYRLTRNQTLSVKARPFIEASRALGCSDWRIMFRHILPNLQSSLLVQCSVNLAGAILAEATLSYLGVGIQPPDPSWGRMLKEAQSYASVAPWLVLAPGVVIALTVIGFSLLGEGWIFRR